MDNKGGVQPQILIYENKVYSMYSKTLSLPNTISFNDEKNTNIIESLKKNHENIFSKDKNKNIEIKATITNFDLLCEKIEKEIENKNFELIDENDYNIISAYSQKELLLSLFESIHEKDIIETEENIKQYFKIHNKEFIKIKNKEEENIKKLEQNLTKQREEISKFKKKTLDLIEKEIKNEEGLLLKLSSEKKEHENIFNLIKDKEVAPEIQKKLSEKEKKINFKIKQLKLDEKLYKAKILTLKNNLKSKKYKTINPLSFIVTLGLIYWTKYSDTKYHILKSENNINKIKEKEILFEKELTTISEELTTIQEKTIEKLKEITKKEDLLQKKIEKIEKEIDKQKNIIEKKYNIRKKNETEYDLLLTHENAISKEYIKKYEEMKNIHSLNEEEFLKQLEILKEKRNEKKKEIQDIIKKIDTQSFSYKKNILITLKHEFE